MPSRREFLKIAGLSALVSKAAVSCATPREPRDFDEFSRRLAVHLARLKRMGVAYGTPPEEIAGRLSALIDANPLPPGR